MTVPALPVWATIRDRIADEIDAGRYPRGSRLPGEVALARRFGVNRHTVRRAMAALSAEGRVHVRRGAGATVLAPPVDYALGARTRFTENMLAAGRLPDRRLLRLETVAATAADAARLDIAPGDAVVVSEGLGLADGVPISLGLQRFPAARLSGIEAALARTFAETAAEGPITRALRAVGVADYARAETRITARLADATEAARLKLAPGAALLVTETLDRDTRGRPIAMGETAFAGERMTIVVA